MSEKRIITIRSGNEEVRMEVTEEEYQRYFRPWWRQKKREQRNREAMEEKGYTEESYEAWRDDAAEDMGIADTGQPDMDELLEKEMLLGVLKEALGFPDAGGKGAGPESVRGAGAGERVCEGTGRAQDNGVFPEGVGAGEAAGVFPGEGAGCVSRPAVRQ